MRLSHSWGVCEGFMDWHPGTRFVMVQGHSERVTFWGVCKGFISWHPALGQLLHCAVGNLFVGFLPHCTCSVF